MTRTLTLFALALAVAPLSAQRTGQTPAKPETRPSKSEAKAEPRPPRRSNRSRLRVQVVDGPRFEIPGDWLDWWYDHRDNLVTQPSRARLDPKKAGEWDREYGTVLDGALPLRDCAFVGGGEVFGAGAVTFGDLQMRVYVLKATAKQVEGLLDTKGAEALRRALGKRRFPRFLNEEDRREETRAEKRLPAPVERFRPERKPGQKGPWRQSRFAFDVWYHDYGGRANIDVRTRAFGEHTAVFAFCYAWEKQHEAKIEAILRSVTWPEKAKKNRDR